LTLATCTGGSYRVKITGPHPDGSEVDYETTVHWGNFGTGLRYGNGQNNGYVGVFPACEGWSAYFYAGAGMYFSTQEPDPSPPNTYPSCPSEDPAAAPARSSVIKPLETDSCDITHDGSIKVFGFANRTAQIFDLNISITRIEGMTAEPESKPPTNNPFP
jgi:hypothetical protein